MEERGKNEFQLALQCGMFLVFILENETISNHCISRRTGKLTKPDFLDTPEIHPDFGKKV